MKTSQKPSPVLPYAEPERHPMRLSVPDAERQLAILALCLAGVAACGVVSAIVAMISGRTVPLSLCVICVSSLAWLVSFTLSIQLITRTGGARMWAALTLVVDLLLFLIVVSRAVT